MASNVGMTTTGKKGREHSSSGIVRGIVSPSAWDLEGRVTDACIATDSGKVVRIQSSQNNALDVLKYLKQYVEARGILKRNSDGMSLIVRGIEVIPHPDFD